MFPVEMIDTYTRQGERLSSSQNPSTSKNDRIILHSEIIPKYLSSSFKREIEHN